MYIKFWITIIGLCCLIMAFKSCELPKIITPATAARTEIVRVNVVQVGGHYITKSELLNVGKGR